MVPLVRRYGTPSLGRWYWRQTPARRQHRPPSPAPVATTGRCWLFPVVLLGAGLVVAELAHVDGAEVDGAGVVREPVHD